MCQVHSRPRIRTCDNNARIATRGALQSRRVFRWYFVSRPSNVIFYCYLPIDFGQNAIELYRLGVIRVHCNTYEYVYVGCVFFENVRIY